MHVHSEINVAKTDFCLKLAQDSDQKMSKYEKAHRSVSLLRLMKTFAL